ncbi:T9SS C-terminal target domain-containing protein [Dysgonomonas sp. 216]|uniref:T9SS type A sorting domain-containing protein n=1 Tax=Dysgonomonas sp. 216 TaxID=2302934 RepID=UPI0013D7D570|nr:T9SS type A sorting domain-containing protein [Dysgonomonas sp. 216]NDW18867.1 T9SS C-terminal target domain-containing protein [Dysgonomonas sp. 216]
MKTVLRFTIVLATILISAYSYSQSSTPVFYNEGKICVSGTDTTKTSLFIYGGLVAGTNEQNAYKTCNILHINSKIVLAGDFHNNVKEGTVFSRPAIYDQEGVFEFKSTLTQTIKTDGSTFNTIPSKEYLYIDFPHVRIANNKHVNVMPEIGMKTKNVYLNEGWLILQARRTNASDFVETTDPLRLDTLLNARSNMAHLFVNGEVTYYNWSDADINKRGFIEVNIALDEHKTAFEYKSLVAFGSPYSSIMADYFMYNFLVAPSDKGFLGDSGKTIIDPQYKLEAGRGHALGVDLRGSNGANYQDRSGLYPGIDFNHRAKDMYTFNRFRYANDPLRNKNQIFGTDQTTAAYQMEKLNTGNIKVSLKQGFNYLANPYTSPLDVSELLLLDGAADWGVISYDEGLSDDVREIINRVWVLNGDASARAISETSKTVNFNYKYYIAKSVGGTYLDEDGRVTIAPLQMFVVYAIQPCEITIPASKRTMGNSFFIRSGNKRQDDFVFEVLDAATKTSDRVSLVVRSAEDIENDDECENVALLKGGSNNGNSSVRSSVEEPVQTPSSQLFVKDEETGKLLSVKFLAIEPVISTPLYLKPSSVYQNIYIRGLRINSMTNVREIWIEDKLSGDKRQLTDKSVYKTSTNPDDPSDRFVLHFHTRGGQGVDDEELQSDLTAFYADGRLKIKGLTVADYGSDIRVYDIGGRQIKADTVDSEEESLDIELNRGAYILSVKGRRVFNVKFVVK